MDFYKRMALVCRRIPEGTVATYGQIALLCRKPKNSRQVGYGLKMGLAGQAHRVVNAKGVLSGAAYFDTMDLQKLLLEGEGVKVVRDDTGFRVDLRKYQWKHTMGDVLELEERFRTEGRTGD